MKKVIRILKKIIIGLLSLLLIGILLLALSIPYGKNKTSKPLKLIGEQYSKLVFTNINIIPMDSNRVFMGQNVYLNDGEIINITADSIPLKKGYKTIAAKGKYLLPGFIDMHAHIFDRTDLPQYLSYGVTTVRNMMGFPMHLRWKKQWVTNVFSGSRLITSSPTLNSGNDTGPFHKSLKSIEDTKLAVNQYINEGYDFIKVYNGIDSLQLSTIEVIAQKRNIQIAGHPPSISLKGLMTSKLTSIEHIEELFYLLEGHNSEVKIRAIAKQLKTNNKSVVINLVAFHRIYKIATEGQDYFDSIRRDNLNPILSFIGKKQLSDYLLAGSKYKAYCKTKYEVMQEFTRILIQENVTILFGTDSGPNLIASGSSVLEEINLLLKTGLTPFQIIQSATYNAGKILNRNDLGKIAIGTKSDLLVLDDNPLKEIHVLEKPMYVIAKDKLYDKTALTALRAIGSKKQNSYTTIGLWLEHLLNK